MAAPATGEPPVMHDLPEQVVNEEMESTVSETLSEWFGHPVDAFFNSSGGLECWGYGYRDGEFKAFRMDIGRTFIESLFRRLTETFSARLIRRSLLEDYERIKGLVHTVVTGQIIKTTAISENLFVEIEADRWRSGFIGTCVLRDQPVRERGKYRPGDKYRFYVKRVLPFKLGEDSKLEIVLSRTTKSLPERMLEDELRALDIFDVKINCFRRIPGAISRIRASARLPQEAIRKVSIELKERIHVEY